MSKKPILANATEYCHCDTYVYRGFEKREHMDRFLSGEIRLANALSYVLSFQGDYSRGDPFEYMTHQDKDDQHSSLISDFGSPYLYCTTRSIASARKFGKYIIGFQSKSFMKAMASAKPANDDFKLNHKYQRVGCVSYTDFENRRFRPISGTLHDEPEYQKITHYKNQEEIRFGFYMSNDTTGSIAVKVLEAMSYVRSMNQISQEISILVSSGKKKKEAIECVMQRIGKQMIDQLPHWNISFENDCLFLNNNTNTNLLRLHETVQITPFEIDVISPTKYSKKL